MADQDFNINVRTTADLAGVKTVEEQLAAVGAKFDAATKRFVSTAGAPEPAAGGAGGLTEITGRLEHSFERMAIHAAGIGLIYGIFDKIKEVAADIEKVTTELDKQGAQLVENAQRYHELARAATTESDVLKIADEAVKNLNVGHKESEAILQRQLQWYERILDVITKYSKVGISEHGDIGKGPLAETLKLQQDEAAKLQQQRDKDARQAISEAEEYKTQFEELSNLPFDVAFVKVAAEVTKLTTEQENLNKGAQDYVKRWDDLGHQIENANKKLRDLLKLEDERKREARATADEREKDAAFREKQVDLTKKRIESADPQIQAILKQEQAARVAREEGRYREADLFEKSAEAFKRGATPQQLEQVRKAESDPNLLAAINKLIEETQKQTNLWQ